MKTITGLPGLRFNSFILVLLILGCNHSPAPEQTIAFSQEVHKPSEPFPLPTQSAPQYLIQAVESSEALEEILSFDRYILLEETEDSFIKEIHKVVGFQGFWFVLDIWEGKVYQYHNNGGFVRMLGKKGEGPGEYRRPVHIMRSPKGLAIIDRSKVLVFNTDGGLVETLKQEPSGSVAFQSKTLVWESPKRIYLFDYPSFAPDAPWHVIAEYGAQKRWKIVGGFGERPEIEIAGMQEGWSWAYTCAALIDNRIWCGTPYNNTLEVYDLEGRLAGHPNAGHEIVADIPVDALSNRKEMKRFMSSQLINRTLLQAGPLVFRMLSNPESAVIYDIFDTHGHLLKKNIHPGKGSLFLMDSQNGNLIGVKTHLNGQPSNQLNLRLFYTRSEYENAIDAGLDLTSNQESHFLWVGRLPNTQ